MKHKNDSNTGTYSPIDDLLFLHHSEYRNRIIILSDWSKRNFVSLFTYYFFPRWLMIHIRDRNVLLRVLVWCTYGNQDADINTHVRMKRRMFFMNLRSLGRYFGSYFGVEDTFWRFFGKFLSDVIINSLRRTCTN